MYRAMRAIHLCAGAFALVFLAVYWVSALQMIHPAWAHMQARTTTREVALPPALSDARIAARELALREGISGELTAIRLRPSGLEFRILRPGKVWQAAYDPATGTAQLRLTDTGKLGSLNRIHQMRGIWHHWIAYNLWAGLLALVGLSILTLGVTGLYLWWRTHRDRRLTGALFVIAVGLTGGLAVWMRFG